MTQTIEEVQWETHPAAELFPLLSGDALQEMADDIAKHGLREPVWLVSTPDGDVVLDGRNRVAACAIAEVSVRTRMYTGDDPIGFSLSQNLRRRHLTEGQRSGAAYRSLAMYEQEAAKNVGGRPTKKLEEPEATWPQVSDQEPNLTPKRAPQSRDKAAKAAGVSGRSVARYKRITEQAPDLAAKVDAGDVELGRAERILRDRAAQAERIEQAKSEAAAQPVEYQVDIRQGDFRTALSDVERVDAIITDPPYPHEFIPLLADLRDLAQRVLTEDGIMAVLIGQTYLPEVYRLLEGGLPYRWTACYATPGNGYVSWPRKIQSNWKPLLVYGGSKRFADVFTSTGSDSDAKDHHKWGQDYNAFHTIIERLTKQGDTVLDPFMGSGTTLLAAHALGRHTIGCDLDPDSVATARERLA